MIKILKHSGVASLGLLAVFTASPSLAGFLCTEGKVKKVIVNLQTGKTEVAAAARRGKRWELKESYDGWAVFTDGNKDARFTSCKREFEIDSGYLLGISCSMDDKHYDARSNLFYSPEGVFAVQIWSLPVGDYQTVTTIHGSCSR